MSAGEDDDKQHDLPLTREELADAIALAEREKAVWNEGRKAYQEAGAAALNPYSPKLSDHAVWADGFEHERSEERLLRRRRGHGVRR